MSGAEGKLMNFSVDQAAGAIVLVFGAFGGLLTVIWAGCRRTECDMNLCYLCRCHRTAATPEEEDEEEKKKGKEKEKEKTEEPIIAKDSDGASVTALRRSKRLKETDLEYPQEPIPPPK